MATPAEIARCKAQGHPPGSAESRGCLHAQGLVEPARNRLTDAQIAECHAKARAWSGMIQTQYMTAALYKQALATVFQKCLWETDLVVASGAKTQPSSAAAPQASPGAFGSPGAPTIVGRAGGLRTATDAELAECRAEAGKLGAVYTLDTTKKELTERKPDAADREKFGGRIFETCLQGKGAAVPPKDTPVAQVDGSKKAGKPQPMRPLVKESAVGGGAVPRPSQVSVKQLTPYVTCTHDPSCTAVRVRCDAYCTRTNKSTVCNDACAGYFKSCLKNGVWRSQYCRLMGLARH